MYIIYQYIYISLGKYFTCLRGIAKFQKSTTKYWIELTPPTHPLSTFFLKTHHGNGKNTKIMTDFSVLSMSVVKCF